MLIRIKVARRAARLYGHIELASTHMASWRIPVIFLTLMAFLLGAAGTTKGGHHDREPVHQVIAVLADGASALHEAPTSDEECGGLTCCMTVHCFSCAVPANTDPPTARAGKPGRLAYQDPDIPQAGRLIAPPTAPPKFA
jgi:hypothetical protein